MFKARTHDSQTYRAKALEGALVHEDFHDAPFRPVARDAAPFARVLKTTFTAPREDSEADFSPLSCVVLPAFTYEISTTVCTARRRPRRLRPTLVGIHPSVSRARESVRARESERGE